jgi:hypothetical protein
MDPTRQSEFSRLTVGGEPALSPPLECVVTIHYTATQPDSPVTQFSFSNEACGHAPEVAMAAALVAFLKLATAVPKPKPVPGADAAR